MQCEGKRFAYGLHEGCGLDCGEHGEGKGADRDGGGVGLQAEGQLVLHDSSLMRG